ncbi:MAG: SemiSWEET family transporter [Ilumatobacteraceae bacterium]
MNTIMGVWCTFTSLIFVWPQVWRMVRHDTSHGISPFSIAHGLVGSTLWFTYGISMNRNAIWISNGQFITAQIIIISVLYRHKSMSIALMAKFAAALAALLLITIPVSPSVVGWMATTVSVTSLMPQVVHVIKTENLHGISVVSWLMTTMSAASWMIYGWILDDVIMSVINYFTIPMMVFIAVKATRWRIAHGETVFVQTR